mgnify:CR=1 FL=1
MVAWKIHVPDALDARIRRRMGESGVVICCTSYLLYYCLVCYN